MSTRSGAFFRRCFGWFEVHVGPIDDPGIRSRVDASRRQQPAPSPPAPLPRCAGERGEPRYGTVPTGGWHSSHRLKSLPEKHEVKPEGAGWRRQRRPGARASVRIEESAADVTDGARHGLMANFFERARPSLKRPGPGEPNPLKRDQVMAACAWQVASRRDARVGVKTQPSGGAPARASQIPRSAPQVSARAKIQRAPPLGMTGLH